MTSISSTPAGGRIPRWGALLLAAVTAAAPAAAQLPERAIVAAPVATYADLADLADAASLVVLVTVRSQAVVKPERAPGLAPGHARLYVEARTEALLAGRTAIGESLAYLVDVPLNAKGKPPKLKKQRFLVFGTPVPGRPGQLQLVDPAAQLPATPQTEQQARTVIASMAAADAPPRVTGIGNAMSVPGNLAGESETQIFLDTASGTPVSLTVVRRPGLDPQWGASWSEIVDQSARAPAPETLAWYRLACFLPRELPANAYLQDDSRSRRQANEDYRFILAQLGNCPRLRA